MLNALRYWWGIKSLTPAELQSRLAQGEAWVVLDVRHAEEFAYHGHIPQAILMPLATLEAHCEQFALDQRVVCVDRAGLRSQKACQILLDKGFTQVHHLTGGMQAWRKANLPMQR